MKKILFFALIFFVSFGTYAQELQADDFVLIEQTDAAYPGFNAKTYRGLFPVGHGQFKMFNYGGTPGNLTALGANETLGSFVFNGYDGTKNVISAVIQAKTITDSKDPRFNFLLSNGVGNQRPNRMTILGQTGYVGIGVVDPTSMLHIKGAGTVLTLESTNGQGYIDFQDATGVKSTIEMQDDDFVLGTTANAAPGDVFLRTNGQNRMTVAANGYVGIGTVTPELPLHVIGTDFSMAEVNSNKDTGTSFNVKNTSVGGKSWGIISTGTNSVEGDGRFLIKDFDNDEVRMTVAENGDIGMGTVNPEVALHVKKANATGVPLLHLETEGTTSLAGFITPSGYAGYVGSLNAVDMTLAAEQPTGTVNLVTDELNRLTVTPDGDIGIGTIDPEINRLFVNTDGTNVIKAKSSNPGGSFINIENSSTGGESWNLISTGSSNSEGAGKLIFQTFGGVEAGNKMTIQTNGNVGVNNDNPTAQLDIETETDEITRAINATVNYDGTSDVRAINATSTPADGFGYGLDATGGYKGVYGRGDGGDYTGSVFGVQGYANGGTVGTRYGVYGSAAGGATNYAGYFAGDATVTGTFNNPSDARLKKNVKDYENALEIINQLEAKTYEFKNSEYEQMGLPTGNQIGFIAQELEEVLPSLVKNNVHPEVTEEDEAGNRIIVKEAVEYKGVNYMSLIPVLTEGIKELSSTVEEKEEVIEALAKDNATMKTEMSAMTKQMDEMAAMLENMNDKFNQMEEDMSSCCLSGTDNRTGSVNTNVELNGSDVPALEQNSPNPFYEQTVIKYYIPSAARTATMAITDIKGSPIKSVNLAGTGLGTVTINANELPVGTYIYTLFVDGKQVESKQMMLVK